MEAQIDVSIEINVAYFFFLLFTFEISKNDEINHKSVNHFFHTTTALGIARASLREKRSKFCSLVREKKNK